MENICESDYDGVGATKQITPDTSHNQLSREEQYLVSKDVA